MNLIPLINLLNQLFQFHELLSLLILNQVNQLDLKVPSFIFNVNLRYHYNPIIIFLNSLVFDFDPYIFIIKNCIQQIYFKEIAYYLIQHHIFFSDHHINFKHLIIIYYFDYIFLIFLLINFQVNQFRILCHQLIFLLPFLNSLPPTLYISIQLLLLITLLFLQYMI